MLRVRSALAVKMPCGNDAFSSAKVFASTHADVYLSLRFSGAQQEGESDHRHRSAESNRPRSQLSPFRAVAPQNETSRVRSGDVLTVLIGDIALQIADALSAIDYVRLGFQPRPPDRAEEVDV